jgi:sugar (pentulose or hexulose) kinase/ribulose-5-phosphate 4-epimerase/fuculose-1-phosphate aldolase
MQIVQCMNRVYKQGLTTSSGGNISIIDDQGIVYITPAALDKGNLSPEVVAAVPLTGTPSASGPRPSSELAFHRQVYQSSHSRGVNALLHAHSRALSAFAACRKMPDIQHIFSAVAADSKGKPLTFAPYGIPGSDYLGGILARVLADGLKDDLSDCALMENHAVLVSGANLWECFERFELLEFGARMLLLSGPLGGVHYSSPIKVAPVKPLIPSQTGPCTLATLATSSFIHGLSAAERDTALANAKTVALDIVTFAARILRQGLCTATGSAISVTIPLGGASTSGVTHMIAMTASGADYGTIDIDKDVIFTFIGESVKPEVVKVVEDSHLLGKFHLRLHKHHQSLSKCQKTFFAVITANPINATTLGASRLAGTHRSSLPDCAVIPESYIICRNVMHLRAVPNVIEHQIEAADCLAAETREDGGIAALLANDGVCVTGKSLYGAYDRLEVLEAAATTELDATAPSAGGRTVGLPESDMTALAELFPANFAARKNNPKANVDKSLTPSWWLPPTTAAGSPVMVSVDIGAGSGRVMAFELSGGRMQMTEMNRFTVNSAPKEFGLLCWDIPQLVKDVIAGVRKAVELYGPRVVSIGVDSFGCDFVIVDDKQDIVAPTICYREPSITTTMESTFQKVSRQRFWDATAVPPCSTQSVFELMLLKQLMPDMFDAKSTRSLRFLNLPDYLHMVLSGVASNEATVAGTTEMLRVGGVDWNDDLIHDLGLPKLSLFRGGIPIAAGTILGRVTDKTASAIGCTSGHRPFVIPPACHDSASALAPFHDRSSTSAIFSCGTWFVGGRILPQPVRDTTKFTGPDSGLSNELCFNGHTRLVRTAPGFWPLTQVLKAMSPNLHFADVVKMVGENSHKHQAAAPLDTAHPTLFPPHTDCNPYPKRIEQLHKSCGHNHDFAGDVAGYAKVIFDGLALSCNETIAHLEGATQTPIDQIYIVGGGAKNDYLLERISQATSRPVTACVGEMTAIGNASVQAMGLGLLLPSELYPTAMSSLESVKHF